VLDGFNLDLEAGTGIRTFTASVLAALQTLETQPALLFGRPGVRRADSDELRETFFYDTASRAGRRGRRLRSFADRALQAAAMYAPISRMALRVPHSGTVLLAPDWQLPATVERYTVPNCFTRAQRRYSVTRQYTTLRFPHRVDVWHATYPLPIVVEGARHITTIHDCIPLRLPHTTLDDKRMLLRLSQDEIRRCDLVLTVSDSSRADILNIFDVADDKIRVVHQPALLPPLSATERSELPRYLLSRFGLEVENYILFVGAIEPKKNVKRLISAFLQSELKLPLVIVGKRAWLWENELEEAVSRRGRRRRIILLGYLSDWDLRRLYAGARCFAFPSLYEGFGLPALEAMSFGLPVVASNAASLPEVCGDAALYVDPYDIDSIAGALDDACHKEDLRAQLSTRGRERAATFTLGRFAAELAEAYGMTS